MTLTEFLLARVADDEAVAQAAALVGDGREPTGPDWAASMYGEVYHSGHELQSRAVVHEAASDDVSAHIARHDPARVLADCRALTALVELYRVYDTSSGNNARSVLETALKQFVRTWSDHPDFNPTWAS